MVEQISVEQAHCFVYDKKSLYINNVRNQYIQPPITDPIVTKEFLISVKDRRTWCLHSSEVTTFRVCADPPKKFEFAQMLANIMTCYR